ncbi:hypothetical protein FPD41_01155, partial [Campylobacter upsaliensis]
MKRIVLLGASNSIVQKGLSKGLKDTLMSAGGGGGGDFQNFPLGVPGGPQKFFPCLLNPSPPPRKKGQFLLPFFFEKKKTITQTGHSRHTDTRTLHLT